MLRLRIFTEPQQGATYDDLLRVATAAEELGFDAFFRSDHYLRMGGPPGEIGSTDAWTTLAGLARDTSRIRLGTLVSPVTFRLPGPLAIAVAGVDQMSGGRVELGLGAGWFAGEHAAYGMDFPPVAERFDRLEEQATIIHGPWSTPDGSTYDFDGAHYQVHGSPALPKPVQKPLPIILGGSGRRRSAALAAKVADEYNANFEPVETSRSIFDRVRAAVYAAGRPADSMRYSVAQVTCVGVDEAEFRRRAEAIGHDPEVLREHSIAGTPDEAVDRLRAFAKIGATTAYLQVLDLADLDHLRLIADAVAPHVR